MLKYTTRIDTEAGFEWIETRLVGKELLMTPLLNKGTAFTYEERQELKLLGKLPHRIETLEEQLARTKAQYHRYASTLQKYIYLKNLHDKNEILFYKLLLDNLEETLPKIYTPGVSAAVKEFSSEFRQPRGLYLAYPERQHMRAIFDNRTHADIDLIVVTDGERILGIGDQGIGGMDIPIAKLVVYSLCGINPYKTLPIMLDVGTDNQQLLNDPLYLGWRNPRLRGKEYDDFIQTFVEIVYEKFPNCFLHWEDFGLQNARRILEKYRDKHCMFNDDMQGTGVVSLAALLAAIQATKIPLDKQRVIIFGAGTAGVGIADQLYNAMVRNGVSEQEARQKFWLVDRFGLIMANQDMAFFQKPYARGLSELNQWPENQRDLLSVVKEVKPTILIGCSTMRNAFTEQVVRAMSQQVAQPIIFPLSNPNENCEANPENLLQWSEGRALIATGSPFDPIQFNDKTYHIAQCNNALSFPGIGIGVLAVRASKLTDNMLWVAAQAISAQSPISQEGKSSLLPYVTAIPALAQSVAVNVAKQAIEDGVATDIPNKPIEEHIRDQIWRPYYRPIKLMKS